MGAKWGSLGFAIHSKWIWKWLYFLKFGPRNRGVPHTVCVDQNVFFLKCELKVTFKILLYFINANVMKKFRKRESASPKIINTSGFTYTYPDTNHTRIFWKRYVKLADEIFFWNFLWNFSGPKKLYGPVDYVAKKKFAKPLSKNASTPIPKVW